MAQSVEQEPPWSTVPRRAHGSHGSHGSHGYHGRQSGSSDWWDVSSHPWDGPCYTIRTLLELRDTMGLRPRREDDPPPGGVLIRMQYIPHDEGGKDGGGKSKGRDRARSQKRAPTFGVITECVSGVDYDLLCRSRGAFRQIESKTSAEIKERAGLRGYTVIVTGTERVVREALPLVEAALFPPVREAPAMEPPPELLERSFPEPLAERPPHQYVPEAPTVDQQDTDGAARTWDGGGFWEESAPMLSQRHLPPEPAQFPPQPPQEQAHEVHQPEAAIPGRWRRNRATPAAEPYQYHGNQHGAEPSTQSASVYTAEPHQDYANRHVAEPPWTGTAAHAPPLEAPPPEPVAYEPASGGGDCAQPLSPQLREPPPMAEPPPPPPPGRSVSLHPVPETAPPAPPPAVPTIVAYGCGSAPLAPEDGYHYGDEDEAQAYDYDQLFVSLPPSCAAALRQPPPGLPPAPPVPVEPPSTVAVPSEPPAMMEEREEPGMADYQEAIGGGTEQEFTEAADEVTDMSPPSGRPAAAAAAEAVADDDAPEDEPAAGETNDGFWDVDPMETWRTSDADAAKKKKKKKKDKRKGAEEATAPAPNLTVASPSPSAAQAKAVAPKPAPAGVPPPKVALQAPAPAAKEALPKLGLAKGAKPEAQPRTASVPPKPAPPATPGKKFSAPTPSVWDTIPSASQQHSQGAPAVDFPSSIAVKPAPAKPAPAKPAPAKPAPAKPAPLTMSSPPPKKAAPQEPPNGRLGLVQKADGKRVGPGALDEPPSPVAQAQPERAQPKPAPKVTSKAKIALKGPSPVNPLPQQKAGQMPPRQGPVMMAGGLAARGGLATNSASSSVMWSERPVEKVLPASQVRTEEEEDPELACYLWDRKAQRPKARATPTSQPTAPASTKGKGKGGFVTPQPSPQRQRELLRQVMDMGFDETRAQRALASTGWVGVEEAVAALFA